MFRWINVSENESIFIRKISKNQEILKKFLTVWKIILTISYFQFLYICPTNPKNFTMNLSILENVQTLRENYLWSTRNLRKVDQNFSNVAGPTEICGRIYDNQHLMNFPVSSGGGYSAPTPALRHCTHMASMIWASVRTLFCLPHDSCPIVIALWTLSAFKVIFFSAFAFLTSLNKTPSHKNWCPPPHPPESSPCPLCPPGPRPTLPQMLNMCVFSASRHQWDGIQQARKCGNLQAKMREARTRKM